MRTLTPDTDDPECNDYTLNDRSCWITANNLSIYILQLGDDAVVVGIYRHHREMENPIATTCASLTETT